VAILTIAIRRGFDLYEYILVIIAFIIIIIIIYLQVYLIRHILFTILKTVPKKFNVKIVTVSILTYHSLLMNLVIYLLAVKSCWSSNF